MKKTASSCNQNNPRQDVFNVKPTISLLDCYDEITKRLKQTVGILYGGNEIITADQVDPMRAYYCWAIKDMLDEALYFLEVMLEKAMNQTSIR